MTEPAGDEFALRWNDAVLSARQATAHCVACANAAADAAYGHAAYVDLRRGRYALDIALCLRARSDTAVLEQWLEVTTRQRRRRSAAWRRSPLSRRRPRRAGAALGARAARPRRGDARQRPLPCLPGAPSSRSARLTLESGPALHLARDRLVCPRRATKGDEGPVRSASAIRDAGRPRRGQSTAAPSWMCTATATPRRSPPANAGSARPAFLGLYRGDLDDAAHVQHAYMRRAVVPPTPMIFPGCNTTPGSPIWWTSTK
jgi:hypothetical protein